MTQYWKKFFLKNGLGISAFLLISIAIWLGLLILLPQFFMFDFSFRFNLPPAEVEWLRSDLTETTKKTVVFAHQRLDVANHYGVKNAPRVRKVLEDSGKVLVVFQGHSHKNDYKQIGGIHYCTLVAMVEGSGAESNGYSSMDLFEDGVIRITGYRKQSNYDWS